MGGEFTLLFWVLVIGIGILLPLSLEVYELIPHYMGNAHPPFSIKNDLFFVKLWFTKFTSTQREEDVVCANGIRDWESRVSWALL